MKIYKKEELEYKNGYIVKGDDVIVVDPAVVCQANELESRLQKACHDYGVRDAKEKLLQSLHQNEEFNRVSEHGPKIKFKVDTSHLDKAVEEAEAIMDELDSLAEADKALAIIDEYEVLLKFINDDFVVSCDNAKLVRFDLPIIGNPLELSADDFVDTVCALFGRFSANE